MRYGSILCVMLYYFFSQKPWKLLPSQRGHHYGIMSKKLQKIRCHMMKTMFQLHAKAKWVFSAAYDKKVDA